MQAKDLGTGKEQKITITSSSGLNKEEVERMMKEAESHAEEDRKRREEIETRNKADQAVYGAERMLKDTGDKLGSGERQAVETAIEGLKRAIEGQDAAAIQKALDALTAAQHKAAEALYKQQSAGGGPSAGPGGASAGAGAQQAPGGAEEKTGDVIDAEVVDDKS